MIARTWRGSTRAEDAEAYLTYLRETGLREYTATSGNSGVFTLRRIVNGPGASRAEFLLVSLWASAAAVERFAGPQPERAVFYLEDDRYLVARDLSVTHYDLVDRRGVASAPE